MPGRGGRQWIVVASHRPFKEVQDNGVAEIFAKYGVDLYLAAHKHSYARSPPHILGRREVEAMLTQSHYADAKGFSEIVVGGAGCDDMK